MEDRTRHLAAAVVLVAATPVATWCLVGDLSSEGFTEDELDYMVRGPDIPWFMEVLVGGLAVGVVVASAAVLGRAFYRGVLRRGWAPTVVLLAVAGVILGLGGRAVTAGGIGANIGGGLFLVLGFPVAGLLVVAALANAWYELRR